MGWISVLLFWHRRNIQPLLWVTKSAAAPPDTPMALQQSNAKHSSAKQVQRAPQLIK
jgi:hypothetical protein